MAFGFLAVITANTVVFYSFAVVGAFFLLFAAFWFTWWLNARPACLSPYSGTPLRPASQLSYYNIERTLRYLYELQDYDNRIFDLRKAAFCRETGRIFPDCITWYGVISVDWDFLQKRYPGNYVSWGSLNREQQEHLKEVHENLNDFQTEYTSKEASPRMIEPHFALAKPGPLYVDVNTDILLGWKSIPYTELEILTLQRPKKAPQFTPIQEIQ